MTQERIYVYAGHFCPPTYRDLAVVQLMAMVCPWLIIVCYRRASKEKIWFSDEECVALWNCYNLPMNVEVTTWDEFVSWRLEFARVTYGDVRNVKVGGASYAYLSPDQKNVSVFLEQSLECVTARATRYAASNLDLLLLRELVAPLVVSRLLEYVLRIRNLYVLVGPPRGGKTTVLTLLTQGHEKLVSYIDTDKFNRKLRSRLNKAFPDKDLFELAVQMDPAFCAVVVKPWFKLLTFALRNVRPGTNVFVEVPYGMRREVQIYRMLGGKILYVGCGDKLMHAARFLGDQGQRFLKVIPDQQQTLVIAHRDGLKVFTVDTDCPFGELVKETRALSQRLLVA